MLLDLAFMDDVERQRFCLRLISSSETLVSHSSTSPDGPRCHQVGRLVGEGLVGCSTIVRKTSFQESVPFPHHDVGNCLLNVHYFVEMQLIYEKARTMPKVYLAKSLLHVLSSIDQRNTLFYRLAMECDDETPNPHLL